MATDFFGILGNVHNAFLIFGIVCALSISIWVTFFRESLGSKLTDAIGRWSRPLESLAERLRRGVVSFIGRWIGSAAMRPTRHEKRRNQRPGKKRAGGKKRRPAE